MNCIICKTEYTDLSECPKCGFPENGEEDDKFEFLGRLEKQKKEYRKIESEFENEKIVGFVIAGLLLIFSIFGLINKVPFIDVFIPTLGLSLCIFGFSLGISKNPILTTSVIFIAVVIILLVDFIIHSADIFDNIRDLIIDAFILIGLIRGLYYSIRFKRLEKMTRK